MGCPIMGRKQIQICTNRPFKRTFGAKRGEITEDCECMHTEELLIYNVSLFITWIIKQKKRGRTGKLVGKAEII
jgi:hypothetical protein